LVPRAQRCERGRGVREGRPVWYRSGEPLRVVVGDFRAELAPQLTQAARENVRVAFARVVGLGPRLVRGIRREQGLIIELQTPSARPRTQDGGEALLPVDKGAVAVEAHRIEVRQLHDVSFLSRLIES